MIRKASVHKQNIIVFIALKNLFILDNCDADLKLIVLCGHSTKVNVPNTVAHMKYNSRLSHVPPGGHCVKHTAAGCVYSYPPIRPLPSQDMPQCL